MDNCPSSDCPNQDTINNTYDTLNQDRINNRNYDEIRCINNVIEIWKSNNCPGIAT